MNKKSVATLLAVVVLACVCVLCVACKHTGDISIDDIVFDNFSTDVADNPDFAVQIGNFAVSEVKFDGETMDKSDYIVKNGYFAFAVDNFKQWGLGKHDIEVTFAKGSDVVATKKFSVTVTDNQPAKYVRAFDISQQMQLGTVELPKAIRTNDYQDFEITYQLTKDGVDVPFTENGNSLVADFATGGQYVFKYLITKNGVVTEDVTNITVFDRFAYQLGKEYASQEFLDLWYASTQKTWDNANNGIKASTFVGLSNGLIQRAKFSGQNYLEVVLGADFDNPSYVSVSYVATDEKERNSFDGNFYATAYKQTVIVDMTNITSDFGYTELFKGGSNLPLWIYSAKFVDQPIDNNADYSQQIYQKANIWGGDMSWDYIPVVDIMELWTTSTLAIKTELMQQALQLGYTHVLFEASNGNTGAALCYNKKMVANFNGSLNGSSTHTAPFENGSVSVTMDITDLANATSEWTSLAGVTSGKLVAKNLTFTKQAVDNVVIKNNNQDVNLIKVTLGNALDLSKLSCWTDVRETNVRWTLERKEIDISNAKNLVLEEGTYEVRALLIDGERRGSDYLTVQVIRPITASDIQGELVSAAKSFLWRSTGSLTITDKNIVAQSTLSLSGSAIATARASGKNYLELTAYANDGWLGASFVPMSQDTRKASSSTFDGAATIIIDLSQVNTDVSFVQICNVNQFNAVVTHAQFVSKPVSDKVDYAHLNYCGDSAKYLTATAGPYLMSVNDLKDKGILNFFDGETQIWKAMYTTCNGAIGVDKTLIQQAVASGYTKLTVNVIGLDGASSVLYNNLLGSFDASNLPQGIKSAVFTNGKATITVDITNIQSISGSWAYFVASNDGGTIVVESMFFGN